VRYNVESSYELLLLEGRFGRAEIELGLRGDKSSSLPRVAELSPHRMLADMSHSDTKNLAVQTLIVLWIFLFNDVLQFDSMMLKR
jgi:hypothetical protein